MNTALAITAALIIQTYDMRTRVVTDLEPGVCDTTRCQVLFGTTCEARLKDAMATMARERKEAAEQTAWEAANPKTAARCVALKAGAYVVTEAPYCGPKYGTWYGWGATSNGTSTVNYESTKTAWCVPQRGDR